MAGHNNICKITCTIQIKVTANMLQMQYELQTTDICEWKVTGYLSMRASLDSITAGCDGISI